MEISKKERSLIETDLGRRLDLRHADDRGEVYSWRYRQEEKRFNAMMEAEEGTFDGFNFVNVFHRNFKKENAIAKLYADDSADVEWNGKTYHVGEDGLLTYVMNPKPTKVILFNRSAYLI